MRISSLAAALLISACGFAAARQLANDASPAPQSFRGRVVWLAEAMRRLHGVASDPDAAQANVALETTKGELLPIVKDARGRGFFIDERLRGRELDLLVRRYPGAPQIQIIRVCTFKDGKLYEFDYWCDICAIPMFELKECECCQGPTRIRERLLEGQ